MKVSVLLDKIFFEGASKDFLPLLQYFAGNDEAEIFGIKDDFVSDTTRVLITMPETAEKNSKLKIFLGDSNGDFAQIGDNVYTREEVLGIYATIMADRGTRDLATGNLKKSANALYHNIILNDIIKKHTPKEKQ